MSPGIRLYTIFLCIAICVGILHKQNNLPSGAIHTARPTSGMAQYRIVSKVSLAIFSLFSSVWSSSSFLRIREDSEHASSAPVKPEIYAFDGRNRISTVQSPANPTFSPQVTYELK